jgi:hypothetical protein
MVLAALFGFALQLAPSICGVQDPARMSEDQGTCVEERAEQILADLPDPLLPDDADLEFENSLFSPHQCSHHGAYVEPAWPVDADGEMIEIADRLVFHLAFDWQADGRTADISVSALVQSSLSTADMQRFADSARDALTRWRRPPSCIGETPTRQHMQLVYEPAD